MKHCTNRTWTLLLLLLLAAGCTAAPETSQSEEIKTEETQSEETSQVQDVKEETPDPGTEFLEQVKVDLNAQSSPVYLPEKLLEDYTGGINRSFFWQKLDITMDGTDEYLIGYGTPGLVSIAAVYNDSLSSLLPDVSVEPLPLFTLDASGILQPSTQVPEFSLHYSRQNGKFEKKDPCLSASQGPAAGLVQQQNWKYISASDAPSDIRAGRFQTQKNGQYDACSVTVLDDSNLSLVFHSKKDGDIAPLAFTKVDNFWKYDSSRCMSLLGNIPGELYMEISDNELRILLKKGSAPEEQKQWISNITGTYTRIDQTDL